MTTTKENARLDVEPIQTSGESDTNFVVSFSSLPLPHSDFNTPETRRQDTQRNFTNGDIFQRAKEAVTVPEAARRLGLEPNSAGKIRCFHPGDDTPSLQLYPDHWHCYGCGEGGSVIDLVAKYRDMKPKEAAAWLLGESALPSATVPTPKKPKAPSDYGTRERVHVYSNGTKKVIYRRADGSKYAVWYHMEGGRWTTNRGNAPHVLYEQGTPCDTVRVVEGEKDAENLAAFLNGSPVSKFLRQRE